MVVYLTFRSCNYKNPYWIAHAEEIQTLLENSSRHSQDVATGSPMLAYLQAGFAVVQDQSLSAFGCPVCI